MSSCACSEHWQFSDILGRAVATYRMGSISARVEDHDGRAVYEVRRGDEVIASGGDPDLDASLVAVEDVLVDIGWLMREPIQSPLCEAA